MRALENDLKSTGKCNLEMGKENYVILRGSAYLGLTRELKIEKRFPIFSVHTVIIYILTLNHFAYPIRTQICISQFYFSCASCCLYLEG